MNQIERNILAMYKTHIIYFYPLDATRYNFNSLGLS